MNRFVPLILLGALSCATSGLAETMVIIASPGRGMGCQVFQKGLGQPTARWTSGSLIADWDSVIHFDPRGMALVEKGWDRQTNLQWTTSDFLLASRPAGSNTPTTLLSRQQVESAIRASGWTPPAGPRKISLIHEIEISPAQRWLAFMHARPEADASDVWVCDIAGRGFTKISDGNRYDEMPAWSPDSTRLAFYRTDSRVGHGWGTGETTHPAYALWVWDRRTSQSKEFAPPGQYADLQHYPMVWSPDGSKILFNSAYDTHKERLGVYIVNSEGGAPKCLSEQDQGSHETTYGYKFSPDGSKVVYTWRRAICLVNADGTDRRTIVPNRAYYGAQWNSDGSRLLLRGISGAWFLVRPDGSDLQPIVPPAGCRIIDVFTYME